MTELFDTIIEEIFKLDAPKISGGDGKKQQIKDFIKTTINGDTIKEYLVINANIKPKLPGALLYVLTNVRLIRIQIGKDDSISSSSFFLNTMTSIERKLLDDGVSSIDIIFQGTSVGLRYPSSNKKITEFFQAIEQVKATKEDKGSNRAQ